VSWLGELATVCQYKTRTRCATDAAGRVMTPGGSWWLCRHHFEHGALTAEERATWTGDK
jgi:hypothetical protein